MKTLREEDVLRLFQAFEAGRYGYAWFRAGIAALPDASPQGPGSEERPTITVSGPIACGKSAVMEIIYRALREAGLHPFSDQLAHERRMVEEQPRPRETVWELIESARLLRAPQQQGEPSVARIKELEDALRGLDPYLDQLVCFASTPQEYKPNRAIANARRALAGEGGKG